MAHLPPFNPRSTGFPPLVCLFTNCNEPALDGLDRCFLHRHRRQCLVGNCTNQVYARNRCVRHGGKKKCQYAGGCRINVFVGDYCARHANQLRRAATIRQSQLDDDDEMVLNGHALTEYIDQVLADDDGAVALVVKAQND
ncbi:Aste57867_17570 [Aphanomyces stellatus]|uniref:Aste57867_17570 protein n=1 Tax=Aphanomyces stellatus TaxID=120398 RepID=A0A485L9B8_9STRA|nr:hypothetical protein As57867_017510 [Aphanomyces stellatus]VFT94321.1 Aste57867_17570 [Aphanomyces stellatus]